MSDPQEAATPSDPHSAEAEKVAELKAYYWAGAGLLTYTRSERAAIGDLVYALGKAITMIEGNRRWLKKR